MKNFFTDLWYAGLSPIRHIVEDYKRSRFVSKVIVYTMLMICIAATISHVILKDNLRKAYLRTHEVIELLVECNEDQD